MPFLSFGMAASSNLGTSATPIEAFQRSLSRVLGGFWVGSRALEIVPRRIASEPFRSEVAHRLRSSQVAVVNAEALKLTEQVLGQHGSGAAVYIAQLRIQATPAILPHRATVVQLAIDYKCYDLRPAVYRHNHMLPGIDLQRPFMSSWVTVPISRMLAITEDDLEREAIRGHDSDALAFVVAGIENGLTGR